ncbi:MAG: beta-L-arabinofuranosidase domain-containing protein [Verrucomicrobiota bacterium]
MTHSGWLRLAWSALLAGGTLGAAPVPDKITAPAASFPLGAVRLLEGPFKDAQAADEKFILGTDGDRLLVPFREVAGLPVTKPRYGGWEDLDRRDPGGHGPRGQSLGHYLSACAQMYAATGNPEYRRRVDAIVAQLAEIQAAHGNGYVAGIPEKLFEDVFAGGSFQDWVPWYNVHKTLAGLIDAYTDAGNRPALAVAVKFAGWAKRGTDRMSEAQFQASLEVEHGGINEAFANLYALTGDPEHLALARRFWQARVLDPLARGVDDMTGLHANTLIPKLTGAARLHELTGDPRYEQAARFAWEQLVRHRSFVTGSNSEDEFLFPVGEEASRLSTMTAESCNVYNLLKLTRHVFAWRPEAEAMDYYERALYNHILGSIDPRDGTTLTFLSLKPGHFKSFCTPGDSWWCCTGTGMENHARYGESIYFRGAADLWVNLFIASELTWPEQGLVLRQETQFPASDTTLLRFAKLDRPAELTLHLRVPSWAGSGARVSVNGETQPVAAAPGSYLTLRRTWRQGDRVELTLPMSLRLHHAVDDPHTVAVLYGPLVLAGELGRQELPADTHGVFNYWPTPFGIVPVLLNDQENPGTWLQPVPGQPLHFQTVGTGVPRDVVLSPLYALNDQRYTVYWKMFSAAEWRTEAPRHAAAAAAQAREEARRVDAINFGEMQPERDHAVQGEKSTTGEMRGVQYREAVGGGWFSAGFKCDLGIPLVLRCRYWGNDTGNREYDILIDGTVVATQVLDRLRPRQFCTVEYPVPATLTRGKERMVVRFQAHPGKIAGRVFACTVLRQEAEDPAPPKATRPD